MIFIINREVSYASQLSAGEKNRVVNGLEKAIYILLTGVIFYTQTLLSDVEVIRFMIAGVLLPL